MRSRDGREMMVTLVLAMFGALFGAAQTFGPGAPPVWATTEQGDGAAEIAAQDEAASVPEQGEVTPPPPAAAEAEQTFPPPPADEGEEPPPPPAEYEARTAPEEAEVTPQPPAPDEGAEPPTSPVGYEVEASSPPTPSATAGGEEPPPPPPPAEQEEEPPPPDDGGGVGSGPPDLFIPPGRGPYKRDDPVPFSVSNTERGASVTIHVGGHDITLTDPDDEPGFQGTFPMPDLGRSARTAQVSATIEQTDRAWETREYAIQYEGDPAPEPPPPPPPDNGGEPPGGGDRGDGVPPGAGRREDSDRGAGSGSTGGALTAAVPRSRGRVDSLKRKGGARRADRRARVGARDLFAAIAPGGGESRDQEVAPTDDDRRELNVGGVRIPEPLPLPVPIFGIVLFAIAGSLIVGGASALVLTSARLYKGRVVPGWARRPRTRSEEPGD